MGYQFIKADVRDRIAFIEMDRKRELNALSYGMMKEIHQVFNQVLKESSERSTAFHHRRGSELFPARC